MYPNAKFPRCAMPQKTEKLQRSKCPVCVHVTRRKSSLTRKEGEKREGRRKRRRDAAKQMTEEILERDRKRCNMTEPRERYSAGKLRHPAGRDGPAHA